MKLLHIISGDQWAGAEVQFYNSLIALSSNSEISIKCILFNNATLSNKLAQSNIDFIIIDEQEYSIFGITKEIKKVYGSWNPDIIHVHLVKEHLVALLANLLRLKKIPIVRTVHGARKAPDYLPFKKKIRSNFVVTVDNLLITYFSDVVVAVSKHLEQEFKLRKVKGKIYQIYNAIHPPNYLGKYDISEIRSYYVSDDIFWIGTAARLAEPKNLSMLVKAGRLLLDKKIPFKISIFGEGPLKNQLQHEIAELGLEGYVTLHGFEYNIAPVISALDVFVLCSIHEGLPMVLLEAMILKTPIIGTDVKGINEVIIHKKNGLLVPLNDIEALADSLLSIYRDKSFSEKLNMNAAELLEREFSLVNMGNKLTNLYSELCQK